MRTSESPYLFILPKVEPLYWAIRSLAFFGLLYHMLVSTPLLIGDIRWWAAAAGFGLLVAIPGALAKYERLRLDTWFWPLYALDLTTVTVLVYITGGIESNFFVLYYALVPYVAYYAGQRVGHVVAACVTIVYAIPCFALDGLQILPGFIFRMAMMWIFTFAMGVAYGIFGMFSQRLLNAMDKLNERTSELERTHLQLQSIYETSHSLAELMPIENVIDRVLNIARQVLRYPTCEIYTWDPANKALSLKGRINRDMNERLDRPIPVEPNDIFWRVIRDREIVRVGDRHMGRAVIDSVPYRSQMAVPMISEGKIVGLLNTGSPHANAFSERDQGVLSILASSAAMALVNADLHRQMEQLTIIDELTGVYNYRHFRTRFDEEQRRSARYGTPLSLIMVDIDDFKGVNDRYGHPAGNIALRQLARVIQEEVRDVDVVARYGGEEFVVILPQTSTGEAERIGERIRRKVTRTEFGPDSNGRSLSFTVSVGISCHPDNGRPEDDLIESVDQALYRAKGAGKNRLCIA